MYNYGGPRVGNEAFVDLYDVNDSWRVHNENDIVAQIPVAGMPCRLSPDLSIICELSIFTSATGPRI